MTNIKRARLMLGWTQEEMAAQLGITGRTLRSYEQGAPIPSPVLIGIARLTGCTTDHLLGLENENKPQPLYC